MYSKYIICIYYIYMYIRVYIIYYILYVYYMYSKRRLNLNFYAIRNILERIANYKPCLPKFAYVVV